MSDLNTNTNTTSTNAAGITGASLTLSTDAKAARLLCAEGERTIVQNFRNPARTLAVNISTDAWLPIATAPEQFRPLLEVVLETAAKSILKRYADAFTLHPSAIPADLFTPDAIMAEAAGNNSEWLDKEQLTAAWEQSATRKQFITNPSYAANAAYRKAFAYYADLILKLAGKTTAYEPKELDVIVAKLSPADLDTPLGDFIVRRTEALRNKPQRAAVDMDLL